MFATRLRVRPCSGAVHPLIIRPGHEDLVGGLVEFDMDTGAMGVAEFPLGPLDVDLESAIETFTVLGTGTGLRPIRDMIRSLSPLGAGMVGFSAAGVSESAPAPRHPLSRSGPDGR